MTEQEKLALNNFELHNNMAEGTATIDQVKGTFAGVGGFAHWKKEEEEESNYSSYQDEASKKAFSPPVGE